jgi:hypothetical protein
MFTTKSEYVTPPMARLPEFISKAHQAHLARQNRAVLRACGPSSDLKGKAATHFCSGSRREHDKHRRRTSSIRRTVLLAEVVPDHFGIVGAKCQHQCPHQVIVRSVPFGLEDSFIGVPSHTLEHVADLVGKDIPQ